ncbi:MAG: hypothetical protein J6W45_04990 [Bacteroidales bacterium]|nr:hypothetical protein [Bacteroidales bacterium]
MKVILSKQTLSLVGMLRPELGYYLRRKGETFFAQRSAHGAPPDGHWRFIVLCAELAQNKLHITDIEVFRGEIGDALVEAGRGDCMWWIYPKRILNAADVLQLKSELGL